MFMKIIVFQFFCAFIQLAFSEKVLIYLNATDSSCVVERKVFNLTHLFHLQFYLEESSSFQDCIVFCCKEETCKSVLYSNREGTCLLIENSFDDCHSKQFRLKNHPQLYAVHTCNQSASAIPDVMRTVQEEELLLLHSNDNLSSSSDEETLGASGYSPGASEILNGDVQRNEIYSVVVQYDAESEESADDNDYDAAQCSLSIYQLFEECHINFLLKGEVVAGYKVIMHYSNVEHMELCAYYCRLNWDEDRCGAVSFLISDKNCTLYKYTSDERAKINLKKNERFIEIVACYDDRSDERLENASPLRYYFPKTEDVCIVEFYKRRLLSSWQIIAGSTNASSLQECMEMCRDNEVPDRCTAFNFAKTRSCFLFRKELGSSLYVTLSESVFGQILFCFPGGVTDILN
ncbi:hypothetical protein T01_4221 [Trichinella spiralis]|uniref:Apple domain-containing protein n=1 Tax=Trichinella spiralis TaxID=6334 RepID=A0A0V1BV40_TRISP|nr:hypothetical protein T01_4221 [Trichinella spiralis]